MHPNTQKHQNSQHAFYKSDKVLYAYTEATVCSKMSNAPNYPQNKWMGKKLAKFGSRLII